MRRSESVLALLISRAVSSSSALSIIALFLLLLIFCEPSKPKIIGASLRSGCGSGKTGLCSANRLLKRRAMVLVSSRCGSWSFPTGTTVPYRKDISAWYRVCVHPR